MVVAGSRIRWWGCGGLVVRGAGIGRCCVMAELAPKTKSAERFENRQRARTASQEVKTKFDNDEKER
jgi:hypothetical protein